MFQGNWIYRILKISLCIVIVYACNNSQKELPIIGKKIGPTGDLVPHTIRDFSFINQNGDTVSSKKYEGKVYVADFFFTTCKTICPQMTKQLARVQNELKGTDFHIISHTVNPEYDTQEVLLEYANHMNANLSNWDFVTGRAQRIYRQALSYKLVAIKDTTQEIPFVHSETVVLIDQNKNIRGMYDGTKTNEVNQLIKDIKWLVNQK